MTESYKSYRIVDGEPKWVIVDKNGDIIDRNPNKIELKDIEIFRENDGRSRPRPKTRYEDDVLLEFLKKSEREEGRPPTSRDFDNNPEYPGSKTYIRHFGSWNNALKMAGFMPIESRCYQYTDEELLGFLRKFERENERSPKEEDFDNNPEYPGHKTYQRRFGSWNNALKMAGADIVMKEPVLYKSWRIPGIGEKPRWVIIDENGNIINKSPSREELKCLEKEHYTNRQYLKECLIRFYEKKGRIPIQSDLMNNPEYPSYTTYWRVFGGIDNALRDTGLWKKRYNPTNTCYRCIEEGKTIEDGQLSDGACREKDKYGKETGKWVCTNHWVRDYQRYDPNSTNNLIKSMADCRTGNRDPDDESTKGDRTIDLACELYGYVDLNKKYDNYTTKIDCQDPVTKMLYQIRGKIYSSKYGVWVLGPLEYEWCKDYEDMIFFCFSNDRKIVERIYRIPFKDEIKKKRKSAIIYKNPSRGVQWYEQYRVKDEDEINEANEIWQKILDEDDKKKKRRTVGRVTDLIDKI